MSVNVTRSSDWTGYWPSGTGVIAIIDGEACFVLEEIEPLDAMSCWDLMADDPGTWEDLALLWPRYQFLGVGSDRFEDLGFEQRPLEATLELLAVNDSWFAVDLRQKRMVFAGQTRSARIGSGCKEKIEASFHTRDFAPWWEVAYTTVPTEIDSPRESPLVLPNSCRGVLWGKPLCRFFAQRMVNAVITIPDGWKELIEVRRPEDRSLTIEIHRDWLMTPRADMGGDTPREKLHLGMEWIERLALDQEANRYGGGSAEAVPSTLSSFETAPMGRAEVIFYFHACRKILEEGWKWLTQHHPQYVPSEAVEHLAAFLQAALHTYLVTPGEEELTPEFIILQDRGRIPITISGPHDHESDEECCPLCTMMGIHANEPWTLYFDGHECELDDEFAFSLWPTREEWEIMHRCWDEIAVEPTCLQELDDQKGTETVELGVDVGEFMGRCCEAAPGVARDMLSESENSD